jgi:hypothetical protein
MVVAIVAIATVGQIIRARYKSGNDQPQVANEAETQRMREEVKALKERVAVLERIATDREHALAREIELLRDH